MTVFGLALVAGSALYASDSVTTSQAINPPAASSGPSLSTKTLQTSMPETSPPSTKTSPTKKGRARSGIQSRPTIKIVAGVPAELRLPTLGVDASVTEIGLDGSLTLVPPSDYTTVGWWALGAKPGSRQGTAILAGHTVHTGGGALDNLEDVDVGDEVFVSRSEGELVYTVSSVTIFRKGTLADEAGNVFAQDGPGQLAVVTCEDWNGSVYLSNVVVIASDPRPAADG